MSGVQRNSNIRSLPESAGPNDLPLVLCSRTLGEYRIGQTGRKIKDRCLTKVALEMSHCWQRRQRSLAYSDTEPSESCIGLAHGQMTFKMGETFLADFLIMQE